MANLDIDRPLVAGGQGESSGQEISLKHGETGPEHQGVAEAGCGGLFVDPEPGGQLPQQVGHHWPGG